MRDQLKMPSTLLTNETQKQDMSQALALTIAQAADDRKGDNIVILRVAEISYLADYFVIVTGFSRVQVRAISQWIEHQVETQWQRLPLRTEGQADSSWILQDYGEVIVHILLPQEREFYNLEAFWGHAEQIEFHAQEPQP
ncbi:MAG TPA: ribosome silencing factor [Cyanobacteria bacterium UBA11162]|nr:ribosome silencing factor [Cyanobacteria bacterium UBA12227]HAX85388.1 ribosome silencing factor [Cyanobacteria bacterium UBA11370]HBL13932.1 ribosome silencing factor [Cyanobacteria bacterium UBA11162]HBY79261.1 ribosome silencing factor [Cyanobacteria bacterium UBA11148]